MIDHLGSLRVRLGRPLSGQPRLVITERDNRFTFYYGKKGSDVIAFEEAGNIEHMEKDRSPELFEFLPAS